MLYIFANCNFVPDHYDAWQAAFDELAEYASANEPTTLTYYFGVPVEYSHDISKTPNMFAFEAYGTKEDLFEIHSGSEQMKKFLATIPEHSATDASLSFYSAIGGFIDRDGDKEGCAIMVDQHIVCKSGESRSTVLENLENLVANVQTREKEHPSGLLTFLGFSCNDDETSARIFSRFDSRESMESFLRNDDVTEFWKESKADIASMMAHRYVPNGKGWLHRNGDTHETGKAI